MSKRYNLQHAVTSLLIFSVELACLWITSDAKKQYKITKKPKREWHGAISQSDAHISKLSHVNKKTNMYPERVKK